MPPILLVVLLLLPTTSANTATVANTAASATAGTTTVPGVTAIAAVAASAGSKNYVWKTVGKGNFEYKKKSDSIDKVRALKVLVCKITKQM
jgi:recombination DNA repair RAD52 pathway protein